MSDSIITKGGTTASIKHVGSHTFVVLNNPDAPADMRDSEAGLIIDGGFQSAPFAAFGMKPDVLRAIADLIETNKES